MNGFDNIAVEINGLKVKHPIFRKPEYLHKAVILEPIDLQELDLICHKFNATATRIE